MGPFYCPADESVYLDLSFCEELQSKFRAPGDFAVAYVLAHEVGHHVQKQTGYTDLVDKQGGRVSKAVQNQLSVRLELQADYLAGVRGARRSKDEEDPGVWRRGRRAAGRQRGRRRSAAEKVSGVCHPDSFTHGSSEQRSRWFRLGLETGDLAAKEPLICRRKS